MDGRLTSLERAFELARSGTCADLNQVRRRLRAEGYAGQVIEGPSLMRQIRELCRFANLTRASGVQPATTAGGIPRGDI
jgi:hypothetical protein